MKRNIIRVAIVTAIIAVWCMLYINECRSESHQVEVEAVWPNSIHSFHKDQCNPWCANQDNGGIGFIFHYKSLNKHINFALGKINLTNSYGDPASVDIIQPMALDYESDFFLLELAIWNMKITGYFREKRTDDYHISENGESKNIKEYDDIIVHVPAWPVPRVAVNPLYPWTENFRMSFRSIYFPAVRIDFVTMSYMMRF
jgi:hypothetical protein